MYEATGQISTLLEGEAVLPTVIAAGDPAASMLAALTPAIVEPRSNAQHGSMQDSDTSARSKPPGALPVMYSNASGQLTSRLAGP